MTTLTFQNTTLSVINQQNQLWLSTSDIAKALGYSRPDLVLRVYDRHQDEFTPNMTALIDMQTNGGMQKVRIFSLRGCHLIGMLSHTKVAKDFRKWVLDILDKEVSQNIQPNLPLAEEPKPDVVIPHEQAVWIARYLARAKAFGKEVEIHQRELFNTLGVPRYERNDLAAKGYDLAHEFNHIIDPFINKVLPQAKLPRLA